MKHKNIIIYTSSDYEKFVRHPANPETRTADAQLIDSMKRLGWLSGFPALCVPDKDSDRLLIVEGHRRIQAARKTNTPVKFVVESEVDGVNPRELSVIVRPWSTKDCIQSHAQTGNKHYQELQLFSSDHQLSPAVSALLLGGTKVTSQTGGLRGGDFKVTHKKNAEAALRVMRAIRGDGETPRFKWWNSHRVGQALSWILEYVEGFSVDQMVSKIKAHGALMDLQPTARRVVQMLEAVYNRHYTGEKLQIYAAVDAGIAAAEQARRKKFGRKP